MIEETFISLFGYCSLSSLKERIRCQSAVIGGDAEKGGVLTLELLCETEASTISVSSVSKECAH